jgi:hypothetical protein
VLVKVPPAVITKPVAAGEPVLPVISNMPAFEKEQVPLKLKFAAEAVTVAPALLVNVSPLPLIVIVMPDEVPVGANVPLFVNEKGPADTEKPVQVDRTLKVPLFTILLLLPILKLVEARFKVVPEPIERAVAPLVVMVPDIVIAQVPVSARLAELDGMVKFVMVLTGLEVDRLMVDRVLLASRFNVPELVIEAALMVPPSSANVAPLLTPTEVVTPMVVDVC